MSLELKFFCVLSCFHTRIPKPCLLVRLSVPREKKSPWLRQHQSYINWSLIHQWKGLYEYYNMETHKFEFLLIKVAKAWKNSSVRRHFPRLYIGVALQCSSVARCPPWKQHLYLLPPNKFLYLYLHHTLIRHC